MKVKPNFRYYLFRLYDYIRGNRISQNIDHIKSISAMSDHEKINDYQKQRFDILISDITKNVQAYLPYSMEYGVKETTRWLKDKID